ncbi:MAG: helix-turn-helix domain-containing protein [Chitinispirillia bacterium]|nr:helix-turn-helix domain-containing protein [Chitinispirillia bacterium]MCL2240955.1 helix-turn-helix domain-containing protein [Chitinispirillia bacterium]
MAENTETPTPAPEPVQPNKERVGDILRKERLTRRITVETIAKDLKLNASYIKALEASEYASLPADPYVRVYIKSLTKYLSLDSDAIMKDFYVERGLITEDKEGAKIDISVKKQENNPAAVVAASLVVALAVFAFVANQKGWISHDTPVISSSIEDRAETASHPDHDAELTMSEDSVLAAMGNPDSAVAATKRASGP